VLHLLAVTATSETTIDLLRRVPLFATLSEEELAPMADMAATRRLQADDVVFREGDFSSTCYVIRAGHACALREHSDGRALTLARFGPGDIFGELAMLDDERRSATVKALDDLEVIAIRGPDMRRLLYEHPRIAVKLITTLGRRLRETSERLAGQSFETVQTRVAKVLSQLVDDARSEAGPNDDIVITSTQAEVARLAGSSRESASRFLAALVRAGIITQGRGRLTVHDPAALERYVY
jgi:CRP/FNR family transcriptional regulator